MGFIGKGFAGGTIWWLLGVVYAFQTIIIGSLIAPRMRDIESATTLGGVYGAKVGSFSQFIVGALSVGLCAGFGAVMLAAGGKLFANFFGWPVWIGVVLTAVLTTIYTITGGLRASVSTDAFQFVVFTILIPLLLVLIIFKGQFDISKLSITASNLNTQFFNNTGQIGFVALVLSFLIGETMIPPYASRALGAKDKRKAQKGFWIAGIFAVIWFLCVVLLGIASRQFIEPNVEGDMVLLNLLHIFPDFMRNFVGIALLGVIMSSLDSLLNSGGVAFSEDVVAIPFQKNGNNLTDQTRLNYSRVGILAISIIGCIGALYVKGIVDGLLKCYAMWGPAIIPSLFYVLLAKRPSRFVAISSILTGILIPIAMQLKIFSIELDTIIVGTAFSVSVLVIFSIPSVVLRRSS